MKKTFILCLLSATIVLPGALCAASDYPLEKRSRFQSTEVARNPFWPIGYVHQPKRSPVVAQQQPVAKAPTLTPDSFVVTSILIGGGLPLAVVNGKEVAVGDQMNVQGTVLEVASIVDGAVMLIAGNQQIAVPLRRK